eukprot:TRINITY_DN3431_c0_g1_i2.p1 TRINITY_DN3431_c0_g1~~TRINITY_DN3431_c0_g1_i2.p1  ORF type:complete len:116 (-),score=16.00 TRINITY_DN3431_c0_g1_i2:71-418(-)
MTHSCFLIILFFLFSLSIRYKLLSASSAPPAARNSSSPLTIWVAISLSILYNSLSMATALALRVPVALLPYSALIPVSYTHLRAHETPEHLVCRLLLEKKKKKIINKIIIINKTD